MDNQNNQEVNGQNSIRNVPVWRSTDIIEMNGLEWQEIFNFINNINPAYMAAHSVLNRNLLTGTIKMKFEKLNPSTNNYEPMDDKEAEPLEKEFEQLLKDANEQAKNAVILPPEESKDSEDEKNTPYIDAIVDQNGTPISSEPTEPKTAKRPNKLTAV